MLTDRVRAAALPIALVPLALVCSGGLAAAPEALDMVPADAELVVAFRQIGDVLDDLDRVNALAGPNADPGIAMMAAMLRGTPGLDAARSAAMVLDFPDAGGTEPESVVAILPVTNFNAFVGNAQPADGVTEFVLGSIPAFARPIEGGLALVGPTAEAVRAFRPGSGQMAAHGARLGHSGRSIADGADLVVIADVESFRPMLLEQVQMMQQQAEFFAAMAGGGEAAGAGLAQMVSMARSAIQDARTGVLAMSIDEAGITLDLGAQFNEGTESFASLDHRGDANSMLSRLPAGEYMLAYAADMRSPGFARLAGHLQALQEGMGAGGGVPGQMDLADLLAHASGTAAVIGANPAMMTSGLFSTMVQYVRTDDAAGYLDLASRSITEANGQSAQGMSFLTSYTPGDAQIAGATANAYAVKITPDAAAAGEQGMGMMDPNMMMQMMFGPTRGPNGYLIGLDSGVVQTMSRNTPLAERAVQAARAANGLGTDARLAAVAARLPADRVAEVYLSGDQIMNTAGPMMLMFGVIPEFEPVDPIDPIAMGLSTVGGGMQARIFVPNAFIEKVREMVPADPALQQGGEDDGELEF